MTLKNAYLPPLYTDGPIPSPVFEAEAIWRFLRWCRVMQMTGILSMIIGQQRQHVQRIGLPGYKLHKPVCASLSWLWWGLHIGRFHVHKRGERWMELREGPGVRSPYELDLPMPQPEVRRGIHTRSAEFAQVSEVPKHPGALDSATRFYRQIAGGDRQRVTHDRRKLRPVGFKVGARWRVRDPEARNR